MRTIVELQQQLAPDLLEVLKRRYRILQQVGQTEYIGRRALAGVLAMTERVLRAETDFLKAQGLLDIRQSGMQLSDSGRQLLDQLAPTMKELAGLTELEERIRSRYGLRKVVIVSGDSEASEHVKRELGRAGAQVLRGYMAPGDVVAVTGGTTMAHVAGQLSSQRPLADIRFVPARGGLGESVDYQANTIVSTMAKRTGAQYRLLHVPDHLGEEAYQSLMQEPNIREIVEVIRSARIVLHGIGDAMVMARRRKEAEPAVAAMRSEGALAEAFGFYFDRSGNVVHRMPTAGLRLEEIQTAEVVIAIAGGRGKGEAIAAVMRFGHDDVLITDEAAALEMLRTFEADADEV
ncbi:sugar-binding domain-containing protein [Paenibacillus sp. IB182496]|uniref:Sugar-binding domain-containing protein n=1 Tax=Paenibacillus sabuli TaxID=2772509 RepID=A0A927GTW0_9BACL|nr:sugar-binding domain-containing protein [Paenibacillus sabuli]MBD2847500.1 sugar-binding domain-containing protein [Paenibacillus sabuli]